MESAAQQEPFVHARLKARLVAFVGLEVVGGHPSSGSVADEGFAEPALVELVGGAFEHCRVVVNDGLVGADRLNHAELVQDQNQVREDTEMRAALRDDLAGAFGAVAAFHRGAILVVSGLAPSGRNDAATAARLNWIDVELRGAVAEVARA